MFKDWLTLTWTSLLTRGLVGVAFGVVVMAWPDETVLVVVVLAGCWALMDGLMTIGFSAAAEGTGPKVTGILLGLVSLAVAFFAIVRPGMAATALTWFLGVWLVLRGLVEIVAAFRAAASGSRWLLVLGGVVDVVIGVLFIANPGGAVVSVAFLIGLLAVVWGLALVALALWFRREAAGEVRAGAADASAGREG